MGCQSSCNQGVQHVHFMGRWLVFLKCKQTVYFVIREGSSRNTVQFLTGTDRNHECQLQEITVKKLLVGIGLIINANEKKMHVIVHIWYIYCTI